MRTFFHLLRDFRDDEQGVFAVIFALMAIVLIALGGSVVDYTMFESRRNGAQVALDGAVLALQSEVRSMNKDKIAAAALDLVTNRLADPSTGTKIEYVKVEPQTGTIEVAVRITMPTAFVTLVGVHEMSAVVMSQASRRSTRLEVAMVLDNSGSMDEASRMILLKQAVRNATNIFFEDMSELDPDVFMSIVPFTQFVNVGTQNANKPWIDKFGRSSIADDNFLQDPNSPIPGGFNRLALFEKMQNSSWLGCVEARPFPHDTADTAPTTANPDTLFVPLLAPDEPDSTNWLGQSIWNNNYMEDQGPKCAKPGRNQSFTDRTLQERLCKYDAGRVTRTSITQARGPNADCPYNALTPMTARKATVDAAINAMQPQGGTNIAQGAVWGLHTLTPGAPFEEAEDFDEDVNKSMIILTDGDNFHAADSSMNGSTFYTAYGYPYNRRLGKPGDSTATLQRLMNERLIETCTNAKAMGISVYTIGLAITDRDTQQMLARCSSGDGYSHLPRSASELDGIFKQIAGQLSALRLTR